MRRRLAAVTFAAGTLLLGLAPSASAAEDINAGRWSGSTLNADCGGDVCGTFVRAFGALEPARNIYVQHNWAANRALPASCGSGDLVTLEGTTPVSFSIDLKCNASYTVTAWAEVKNPTALHAEVRSATISKIVVIDEPTPAVTGFVATASADGSAVDLKWNDMTLAAPDLTGYAIERDLGSGFEPVTALEASATTYVDSDLPDGDYSAQYRITAARPDKDGAPRPSTPAAVTTGYTAPTPGNPGGPTNPGDPNAPGGPGGPGDPTIPPTGDTPPDLGDLGTPTAPGGSAGGGGRVRAPRLGITGTFLPPLLRPSVNDIRPTTPTTADTGFDDELPYDEEPGEEDPVLPDDELAAFFDGDVASRGMLIPIATALVLAVWAFHLRMLARLARVPSDGY